MWCVEKLKWFEIMGTFVWWRRTGMWSSDSIWLASSKLASPLEPAELENMTMRSRNKSLHSFIASYMEDWRRIGREERKLVMTWYSGRNMRSYGTVSVLSLSMMRPRNPRRFIVWKGMSLNAEGGNWKWANVKVHARGVITLVGKVWEEQRRITAKSSTERMNSMQIDIFHFYPTRIVSFYLHPIVLHRLQC